VASPQQQQPPLSTTNSNPLKLKKNGFFKKAGDEITLSSLKQDRQGVGMDILDKLKSAHNY
jgi:hypothetical protein